MIAALEREMIPRASRISATSNAARSAAIAIAPHTPIDMIGAGVSPTLFDIVRRPEEFLLYFGRLDVFHKGIDTLLEAVAIVAKRRRGIQLRIAGRGGSTDRIAALAQSLGIAANVRILGPVADTVRDELFATAAIQIMPSRFEGFGLAAAEAMAAGVPLIAASSGSLPEVVDAPRGAWLVPANDPIALAAAVDNLLDDSLARENLSRTARQSARRFDWNRVAEKHLRFVQTIASA
jgi:glycosyltransferase involved in cell wall biosynthesis